MTVKSPERMCFAVCTDGVTVPIGDHDDYEAAKATADDLGLDFTKLYCIVYDLEEE